MGLKVVPLLLKDTLFEWYADRGSRLGAALAFYTLFSLAPLLMISIAITALVFGREIAYTQLIQQIEAFVGLDGARVIQATIEHTSRPSSGILATLIGLATMLFGATIVFSELQDALNIIWKVAPRPRRRMAIGLIWDRLLAFCIVVAIGLLLLLSIVANAVLNAMMQVFGDILPRHIDWLRSANFIFVLITVTLLFIMIYKVLPDIEIGWVEVVIGAMVTAVLFMIGKFLIELYLGYSTAASVYGAAASLVILLMWIYYSAQILYFGAEFTKVYAKYRRRSLVVIAETASITSEHPVH